MQVNVIDGRIYTPDSYGTGSIYGEKIILDQGRTLREWVPWRSKLGALYKKIELPLDMKGDMLYLGAAQGTTVSHISDILEEGTVYAVEFSRTAFRKLMLLARKRSNLVPILADAFHPERYASQVPGVDILYQDVSQKDQSGMFLKNAGKFLRPDGRGILMIKARSIDVTARPEEIYGDVGAELKKGGLRVMDPVDLGPFQKDHACIICTKP